MKSARKRQKSYNVTYMQNLKKKKKNLFTKQKQTHRNRKQSYGYQRGERGGEVGRDNLEGWD